MREPANLNDAVRIAKAIERGVKIELKSEQESVNKGTQQNMSQSIQQNIANQTGSNDIDDLVKQMEKLKINRLEREINYLRNQMNGGNNRFNVMRNIGNYGGRNGNNPPRNFGVNNQFDIREVICWKCNRRGHYANNCNVGINNNNNGRRVNFVEYDELEFEDENYDNNEEYNYNEYEEERDMYYTDRDLFPAQRKHKYNTKARDKPIDESRNEPLFMDQMPENLPFMEQNNERVNNQRTGDNVRGKRMTDEQRQRMYEARKNKVRCGRCGQMGHFRKDCNVENGEGRPHGLNARRSKEEEYDVMEDHLQTYADMYERAVRARRKMNQGN
jgi:hypothetical protein